MKGEFKLMIGGIVLTFLLIVGLSALVGGKKEEPETPAVTAVVEGIQANPENYDLGSVPIKGGLVTKEYEIKNISDKTIKLKKIATSCMCTKASFEIGDTKTKAFGMEGMGTAKNPPVNIDIPSGSSGKVVVQFDPNAHGPAGVGPIDRSVFLTFSDPAGIKELKFKGTVVN